MNIDVIYKYLYYPNKTTIHPLFYIDDDIIKDCLANYESSLWLIFPVNKLYFQKKILEEYIIDNKNIIILSEKINNPYSHERDIQVYEENIYEFELIDGIYLKAPNLKYYFTLDAFAYLLILCKDLFYIDFFKIKYFGLSLLSCAIELGIVSSDIFKQEYKENNNFNKKYNIKFKLHPEKYISTTINNQKKIITACINNQNILLTGSTGVGKTKVVPKLISLFNLYFGGYNINFNNIIESIYNLNIKYSTTFIIAPKKILIKSIAKNIYSDLGFNKIENSPVKLNYKRNNSDENDNINFSPDDINNNFKKFKTPIIVSIDVLTLREISNIKTLIVDEVHEHSMFSDISILIAIKNKLQLVLISATIDDELKHIKKILPNIVHIHLEGGTLFEIEKIKISEMDILNVIKDEMENEKSIIWFLSTKNKIKNTTEYVGKSIKNLKIVELYSEIYQNYIINKIDIANFIENYPFPVLVLSTNIAESSITINNAKVVIDNCNAYIKKFYSGEIMIISKQMALQRMGRVGRVFNGKYYYTTDDYVEINKLDYTFLYTYILCNLEFGISIDSFFIEPTDLTRVKKSIDYLKYKKIFIERDYEQIFYITQKEYCNLFEYVYMYINYSDNDLEIVRYLDRSNGNKEKIENLIKYKLSIIKKVAKDLNIILEKKGKYTYNIINHFETMPDFQVNIVYESNKDNKLYLIYPGIAIYL